MPFNTQLDRKTILDLVGRIRPRHAREYAKATNWTRKPQDFGGLAVFDYGERELTQLLIPIDGDAKDYPVRMLDVVQRIAEIEERPILEVSNDLLNPDSDIVRYRIADPSVSSDLGLLKGIEILEGAKRSLLSAAHSILAPVKYHPRLSKREPKEFLDQCRLKQTEHGSFVVAIACPLDAVDTEGLLEGVDSFTRETTKTLMASLRRIEDGIEADQEATLVADDAGNGVPITANLCDALARMEPPSARGLLEISTSWASTCPNEDANERASVRFADDYFDVIRDVGTQLRPTHQAEVSVFAGFVETLNGNMNNDGRRHGEVILDLLEENDVVRTRVTLDADQYAEADQAHMSGKPVIVKAELHRGRRVHRLSNVTIFRAVTENELPE